MKLNKKEVVQYLNGLCETELVDVFYSAIADRKRMNDGDIDDAYCISNSGYYPNFGPQDSEILALPLNWKGYDDDTNKESAFSGQCSVCSALIACIETAAKCPICSSTVLCN